MSGAGLPVSRAAQCGFALFMWPYRVVPDRSPACGPSICGSRITGRWVANGLPSRAPFDTIRASGLVRIRSSSQELSGSR
ncbi:hypothetical protein STENM327S_05641 [Streptomyces tendae]